MDQRGHLAPALAVMNAPPWPKYLGLVMPLRDLSLLPGRSAPSQRQLQLRYIVHLQAQSHRHNGTLLVW